MKIKEFIKETYINPPNPHGPYRNRLDPTTNIKGELTKRNPSGEISTRWGKPIEINLDEFYPVPNTKLPKRKFREILDDLNLVPSKKEWIDLEWGTHDTIFYHMPNDENDIVAVAKRSGSGGNFSRNYYIRSDIWEKYN